MTHNRTTHGMFGTKTYTTWCGIKKRCLNTNDPSYKKYGAKGVAICDKWLKFEGFLEDMGIIPDGMTIDRKDPRGNYCKDNCRWATPFQQGSENKTNLRMYKYKGEVRCLRSWERFFGFKYATLRARTRRR